LRLEGVLTVTMFRGVYAATVTPFDEDERVDEEVLAKHINHLLDSGVDGIVSLGSTAEVFSLSESEKRRVMEVVFDTVADRIPVFVGASANATRDSVREARAAEKAGAAGLLIVHPMNCLPSSDELLDHFVAVDGAVGIPIMVYNNAAISGVDMLPETFARLVDATTNVRYLKESSPDVVRVGQVLKLVGEDVTVFSGRDNSALEHFLLGAKGWVAGTANAIPRQCVRLFELAVDQDDYPGAREVYRKIYAFLTITEDSGRFIQYVKQACAELGFPVGPPRRPLRLPTDSDDLAKLSNALMEASDYASA